MDIIADIERDHPGLARVMHLGPEPTGPQPALTHSQALLSALQHVQVVKASLEAHVRGIEAKVGRYLPLLERIVSDPFLDHLLERVLQARDAGVPGEVLAAIGDMLDAAIGRTAPASSASDADSRLNVTTGAASAPEPKTDPPPENENAIPAATQPANGEATEAQA